MKYLLAICIVSFISVFSLCAQVPVHKIKFSNITSAQGLSQNTVNCVLQDRRGFLWFGTADGLNRYDGYKFKVYQNELDNDNSLSNNYILSLYQDRSGYIWIGTFGGGLNRFDPNTETFVRYEHTQGDPHSIGSNDIRTIYEDEEGKIWLGIYGGAFGYLNPHSYEFKRFDSIINNKISKPTRILDFITAGKQGFWVGTTKGLYYFNRKKNTYTKRFNIHPNQEKFKHTVYSIFRDRTMPSVLWLCTLNAGLIKFDTHLEKVVERWDMSNSVLKTNSVMSFYQDQEGVYWVGTQKGFYKFNPTLNNSFLLFSSDPQNPRKPAGNNIQKIFEDKAGALWLCSFKRGLTTFNPYIRNFTYYPLNEKGISHISTFCQGNDNNIWVGSKGGKAGLIKLNLNDQTFQTFKPGLEGEQSVASSDINILLKDVDGSIWIGTIGKGLDHYNPETGVFEHYLPEVYDTTSTHLRSPHIGSLYQDKNDPNILWIGTRGWGMFKLSKKDKKIIKEYTHKKTFNGTKISHPTVIAIAKDYKGNLWLATRVGLSRFDPKNEVFQNYFHASNNQHSISGNYISALHIDTENILWIGTHNGLNKIDLEELYKGQVNFKHYTTKQGLPNDIIHKIIEAPQGVLWLSTSKGLSRFVKQTEVFKNYDVQDGLQGNEFSTNSGLLTQTGAVLMGGTNGFNVFYPHKMKQNKYEAPVVFTSVKVLSKSSSVPDTTPPTRPIWTMDTLMLAHHENAVSFEFTALNYILPSKNTYMVYLEGVDKQWQDIGHQHAVTYADLRSGIYTLRVKSINSDGITSNKEAKIILIVAQAWWETVWVKVWLISLAILLILMMYYILKWVRGLQQKVAVQAAVQVTTPVSTSQKIIQEEEQTIEEKKVAQPKKVFKDDNEVTQLKAQLHEVVVTQELYKEEDISLTKIAQKINTTDKKLSELLNKELNTNFYDYINTCKVNAFKAKVEGGNHHHLKLISIAYESGFHSKATFNRIFKKHTGLTPSEYKKQIEKSSDR